VIVAVNGQSVEGQTAHEVLQLLLDSHYQLELTVQSVNDHSSSDNNDYSKSPLISDYHQITLSCS